MRQFEVRWLRAPHEGLVVILQHDATDLLDTCVVAPLSEEPHRFVIDRLRLNVDFGGGDHLLQVDRLAAIRRSEIGQFAGNLDHEERRIKAALDLLFVGF
jgi:hypothetical protein